MKLLFILLTIALSGCAQMDYDHDDFGDDPPIADSNQQYNNTQGRRALGAAMQGFGNSMRQNRTQTCTVWSQYGNQYTQSCN